MAAAVNDAPAVLEALLDAGAKRDARIVGGHTATAPRRTAPVPRRPAWLRPTL